MKKILLIGQLSKLQMIYKLMREEVLRQAILSFMWKLKVDSSIAASLSANVAIAS